MTISTNEAIAAIYYALWQSGYEYACLERDAAHMAALAKFAQGITHPFFEQVHQSTCEVYPFWPRAALLETAAFHVDRKKACFADWDGLQRKIMAMSNVTDAERDESFWAWLEAFPAALCEVWDSQGFERYRVWMKNWVQVQNKQYECEMAKIERCLTLCRENYGSSLKHVQILIDPIKCVYSADYHVVGQNFVFSSGRFQVESVIHEYLHHVVHPAVAQYRALIQREAYEYPDLDASYYAAGRVYAFEEHAVRQLTRLAIADKMPERLDDFVNQLIR